MRVRILKNLTCKGDEYYEQFVGEEVNVVFEHEGKGYELDIVSKSGESTSTFWMYEEVEVGG